MAAFQPATAPTLFLLPAVGPVRCAGIVCQNVEPTVLRRCALNQALGTRFLRHDDAIVGELQRRRRADAVCLAETVLSLIGGWVENYPHSSLKR